MSWLNALGTQAAYTVVAVLILGIVAAVTLVLGALAAGAPRIGQRKRQGR